MKILIRCIPLFFFFSSNAQSVILLEYDSAIAVHQNVNISSGFEDFPLDLFFKNNANDTIQLLWKRNLSANCPLDWEIITADQFLTYVPWVDSSQIPLTMHPADSHFIVRQLFMPKMVAGCCDISLIFYEAANPTVSVDTGYYHIEINSSDCFAASTSEEELEMINIFPNPVSDALNIENTHLIQSIEILDITGKILYPTNQRLSSRIDVSSLPTGIYLCRMRHISGHLFVKKWVKD